jgi:hypothetical protein
MEYSYKMNLGEMEWNGVDWIGLAEDDDKWGAHVKEDCIKCWETIQRLHNWSLLE